MAPDGKRVDVAASIKLIKETVDPSKAGVAERHAEARKTRFGEQVNHSLLDTQLQPSATEESNYQKAKAHREHFEGLISEAKFRRLQGELVERAAVENAAFATGRLLRDLLLGLPKQISAELAAVSDPWELERQLTAGLRRVLEDAQRLSSADLEHAINPQS
jgi:hypothetical protein